MRSILSAYLSTEKISIILTSTGNYRTHILFFSPCTAPLHCITLATFMICFRARELIRLHVSRQIQAAKAHNKPSSHGFFMKMKPEIISVIVRSDSCGSTSCVWFGNVLIFYTMLHVCLKRAGKQKYQVSEMESKDYP